jgi:hypothetical protein
MAKGKTSNGGFWTAVAVSATTLLGGALLLALATGHSSATELYGSVDPMDQLAEGSVPTSERGTFWDTSSPEPANGYTGSSEATGASVVKAGDMPEGFVKSLGEVTAPANPAVLFEERWINRSSPRRAVILITTLSIPLDEDAVKERTPSARDLTINGDAALMEYTVPDAPEQGLRVLRIAISPSQTVEVVSRGPVDEATLLAVAAGLVKESVQ